MNTAYFKGRQNDHLSLRKLEVKTMVVGMLQACCYIVNFTGGPRRSVGGSPDECRDHKNALVIDPGGDGDLIVQTLKKQRLKPLYLVNTHGHIDHIGANTELKSAFPEALLCIHRLDAPMLRDGYKNMSVELGSAYISPEPDKLLEEDDILTLEGESFQVLHIPGHSPGGIVLVYKPTDKNEPGVIFSGDTLFQMGIGRTDFPGGSYQKLINGIKQKIFTLPDHTIVYPGHGPATTVGDEKRTNPFFG